MNIHHGDRYDHYIGRSRKNTKSLNDRIPGEEGYFGNYWTHLPNIPDTQIVTTREEAVWRYMNWARARFQTDPTFRQEVQKLKGSVLGCFCRPKAGFRGKLLCHGQVLAALADGIEPEEVE